VKKILFLLLLATRVTIPCFAQDPEQAIREKTKKFTSAIVAKDLSILDEIFDKDTGNIYYDINEGPLVGFPRLKRVWTAAVSNFTISAFDFDPGMKIWLNGDHAVQVGSWKQTQVNKDGQSREISGRATILWRKADGQWRVWHYHASVTPPRPAPRPRAG
jgi:ketosteroid isomerase-like protein